MYTRHNSPRHGFRRRAVRLFTSVFLAVPALAYSQTSATRVVPSTAVIDTGDFAVAPTDYAKYDTPEKCLTAAQLAANRVWHTAESQAREELLQLTPTVDSLPPEAVTVATACGRKFKPGDTLFTGRNTAVEDILKWFELSLWAMDDAQAHATLTRMITTVGRQRRYDVVDLIRTSAVQLYLGVKPARLAPAESLVAEMERDSSTSILARIRAHGLLLQFARVRYDRPSMQHEAEAILAMAERETTGEWLHDGLWPSDRSILGGINSNVWDAYSALLTMTAYDAQDSLAHVVAQVRAFYNAPAVRGFFKACTASKIAGTGCGPYPASNDVATWTDEEILQRSLDQGAQAMVLGQHALGAQPVSRVRTPFYYPAPPPAGDAVVPASGKVSVFVLLPAESRGYEWISKYASLNRKMQRWITKYGSAGLSVTVLATPRGYALAGEAENPGALATAYDWYYHEYLHMPVNVAVDTSSIDRRFGAPDGRLFYDWSSLERTWAPGEVEAVGLNKYSKEYQREAVIAIVDRAGVTVWNGNYIGEQDPDNALIEFVLARAIGAPRSVNNQLPNPSH